ncbi:MAG: sugar ABC transporter ATP-binding protein [Opitutaceae bacterium]
MPALLQLKQISKSFGPVQALNGVDFAIEAGEVVGLIGENGAGKSTLMNLLGGMLQPTSGTISLDGTPVKITDAISAAQRGISFVHQELNLLDNLNVAGNIFLGREPRRYGCIDEGKLAAMTQPLLDQLGLDIAPDQSLVPLTNGQKQLVEIAKALSMDARILILDEPTSSLTIQETDTLLKLVETLRERGMAIIFITHRLTEIEKVANRVVALRDGELAGHLTRAETNRDAMISLMIGRDLSEVYPVLPTEIGDTVISIHALTTQRWPEGGASFAIREGEILGLAGLVGSGRSELAQAVFGVDVSPSGTVTVNGDTLKRGDITDAISHGVFLAPEDRKASGLVLEMSVRENMTLNSMFRFNRRSLIDVAKEKAQTEEWRREFSVKAPDVEQPVGDLSGGNQQKVVLAKWMTLNPKVMIFDEPTRGIDMGARHEIYQTMVKLAKTGCAILMISSDMEELLGMSHRIGVMCEGHLTGILEPDQFSEESIMKLAVETAGKPAVSTK